MSSAWKGLENNNYRGKEGERSQKSEEFREASGNQKKKKSCHFLAFFSSVNNKGEEPEAKGRFPQSDLGQGNLFTSLLSLSSFSFPYSSPVVHNRPFLSPIFFMSRRRLVFAVAATFARPNLPPSRAFTAFGALWTPS